jgi:hypothetical protein
MKIALVAIIVALSFTAHPQGVKGSQSSSGVPCYLHPAADGCHYNQRPGTDHDTCTTPADKKRLNAGILLVNRTLSSLEQQLIRLGVSKGILHKPFIDA